MTTDEFYRYEERIAIMMYDGNMTEAEAIEAIKRQVARAKRQKVSSGSQKPAGSRTAI